MNTTIAFILSSIAGVSTIIGSLIIFISKKRTLNFLIGGIAFASGVMFFLSILDLIPESIIFLTNSYKIKPSILITLVFFVLGICLSIIINKLFPSTMNNKSLYKLGIITMIGITIHNIPEGIATFITTNENIKLGISITIAITMHNIPEGISIALPIYYYTKSKKKAIFYTMICAISEPIGAIIAYLFLKPNYLTLGIVYAIIAGIMTYISMYELFPSITKYKRYRITYTFYILGLILVIINKLLF